MNYNMFNKFTRIIQALFFVKKHMLKFYPSHIMNLHTHIYVITVDGEVVHIVYLFHYLLFVVIYFGYFFPIWEGKTRDQFGLHIIMFNYLFIVLSLTVVPLTISWNFHQLNIEFVQAINFIPFRDVIYGYAFAKR